MTSTSTSSDFDSSSFLKTLTNRPGVYRMLNAKGEVIYIGKAGNLKKRVTSYFRKKGLAERTRSMVSQIAAVEVTVTNSETEALILENTLIKHHKPYYNVLLRDDKSYPYIHLALHHDFPRLGFHRGAKSENGRYFGPYPSVGAVRETLNLLQKIFRIRQCEDTFYDNRTRPCLQYQIKRCSAPCVGLISKSAYSEDVRHAMMFLDGKSTSIIDELADKMEQASSELDYETAALYRDQISSLRKILEKQYIAINDGDADIIACHYHSGAGCVQVFIVRNGISLGNKAFFPKNTRNTSAKDILTAFIPQYYLDRAIPSEIIVSQEPDEIELLEKGLSENAQHEVRIHSDVSRERKKWLNMALENARHALGQHLSAKASIRRRMEELNDALQGEITVNRIECFDISHTMGKSTVASCVVFDADGPVKSDYRRFNITNVTPGDDFAAMKQAISRRYKKLREKDGKLPDLLLIDGGKGQLKQAAEVLRDLQIEGVMIMAIAKGRDRKPGHETLFLSGLSAPFILAADSPAFHFIQQIRDEAHRTAISGHRKQRARAQHASVLEDIPGLGPKRRQVLLRQFGGLQGVSQAAVEDIANIRRISRQLAEKVYALFHDAD